MKGNIHDNAIGSEHLIIPNTIIDFTGNGVDFISSFFFAMAGKRGVDSFSDTFD